MLKIVSVTAFDNVQVIPRSIPESINISPITVIRPATLSKIISYFFIVYFLEVIVHEVLRKCCLALYCLLVFHGLVLKCACAHKEADASISSVNLHIN